jgi:hypothetical protein
VVSAAGVGTQEIQRRCGVPIAQEESLWVPFSIFSVKPIDIVALAQVQFSIQMLTMLHNVHHK